MKGNFWNDLKRPILAPSPMDGVTDAAFRYLMDTYSHPSLLITEFVNVEGIQKGAVKILHSFIFHKTKTPTVAQIYGHTPHAFYNAAILVATLGFDGVDINMGCPDKSITRSGGGAGLIRTPVLAKEIIRATKQGVLDFYNGKTLQDTDIPRSALDWVELNIHRFPKREEKTILPVSVKTRIGFDEIVTEDWMKHLVEEEPAAISLHGRTLKQMYTGSANWEEIGKAADIVKKTNTLFLGNGDIKTLKDAYEKIEKYHLDGVLVGRACFGNPWIFAEHTPTVDEQIAMAIDHCEAFQRLTPEGHFASLRKHLAWYTKGIPGSNALRNELMKVENVEDVRRTFAQFERSFSTSTENGVYLTP